MDSVGILFEGAQKELNDILVAELSDLDFTGMMESDNGLYVYFLKDSVPLAELKKIAQRHQLQFTQEDLPEQDWNQKWEDSLEPIYFDKFCGIRTRNHKPLKDVKYEIIITPKMAFGTGYHATTSLMIKMIAGLDLKGKSVLDFGCGTAVLAILASKMGAKPVSAIDNDRWAIANAQENVNFNNSPSIDVKNEDIRLWDSCFDCIFANITRDVLLSFKDSFYRLLPIGGRLLLSGFYDGDDAQKILNAFNKTGFELKTKLVEKNWVGFLLNKID